MQHDPLKFPYGTGLHKTEQRVEILWHYEIAFVGHTKQEIWVEFAVQLISKQEN